MSKKPWPVVCLIRIIERIALRLYQRYESPNTTWETAVENWPLAGDEVQEKYRLTARVLVSDLSALDKEFDGDDFILTLRWLQ